MDRYEKATVKKMLALGKKMERDIALFKKQGEKLMDQYEKLLELSEEIDNDDLVGHLRFDFEGNTSKIYDAIDDLYPPTEVINDAVEDYDY